MKTKTIKLYSFDELSPEAQKKAHEDWIAHNEYFFLSDDLNKRLHELLEENHIKDLNDTSKAGTKPTEVLYSLSYSQGDGAMFEGNFIWNDYYIKIKQVGHYTHYNSKEIEMYKLDEEGIEHDAPESITEEFNELYKKICKELEQYGYDFIEYEDSLEAFK